MMVNDALRARLSREGYLSAAWLADSGIQSDRLVADLGAAGLDLNRDADGGLTPQGSIDWIEAQALREALDDEGALPVDHLDVAFTLDSTNIQALKAPPPPRGQCRVLIADHQSLGQGRHGARWTSPFATGLCVTLSVGLIARADLGALPLAVGLGVREALTEFGVDDVQIKWPNDLVARGGKLGGILIEARQTQATPNDKSALTQVAVGVGLNVHTVPPDKLVDSLTPVCIRDILHGMTPARQPLATGLVRSLRVTLDQFAESGFGGFASHWASADFLRDRLVDVGRPPRYRGTARGIDELGQLVLETGDGMVTVSSGEVRIREVEQTA